LLLQLLALVNRFGEDLNVLFAHGVCFSFIDGYLLIVANVTNFCAVMFRSDLLVRKGPDNLIGTNGGWNIDERRLN